MTDSGTSNEQGDPANPDPAFTLASGLFAKGKQIKISLISLHGLIRGNDPELGRDADTGGQIKYVLELARELAEQPQVETVELLTRQIIDSRLSEDYAQVEEQLSDKAKIVRIPFGPKRYLKKEALWPYLEMFVDQTLVHFRRHGLPDVIHGHYADAGRAGAHLAQLLHVPYIFTGHSLGRVKQQRLTLGKSNPESLEGKYKFKRRVEAEEMALETASMVVTSTNQEIEQQYQLYDHYQPDRMEVIPPGVDLTLFNPITDDWQVPQYDQQLRRFLNEPDRPMILTLARPDERKNLAKLVEVYGQSPSLQDAANLVMILGTREDIKDLPRSQQKILNHILYLIDKYDLYGKVAYPRTHVPTDIPDLYRLAAARKGVFINPALTEPFGLTLLEAGATGLPIVATNDGGPRDIIGNCNNGLLIDPLDSVSIEKALLRVLTEPDQWEDWSRAGIEGTRKHYSWSNHAKRYLRDLDDILKHTVPPVLADSDTSSSRSPERRLHEFDRLIITDLDNTLTGDDEALAEFVELINQHTHIGFGISTGRPLDSAMEMIEQLKLPKPDVIDTDAGTQLHYGANLTPDLSWRKQIGFAWEPEKIRETLDNQPGFYRQPDESQSEFKVCYQIDPEVSPSVAEIKKILRNAGLRAKVTLSLGIYLDVVPVRGGCELAMRHLLWKWGLEPGRVLVAGDSGNDAGLLLGRTLGVVVGNHDEALEELRDSPRIYFAQGHHARGVIEGINYYQFLDNIVIPNDPTESSNES